MCELITEGGSDSDGLDSGCPLDCEKQTFAIQFVPRYLKNKLSQPDTSWSHLAKKKEEAELRKCLS